MSVNSYQEGENGDQLKTGILVAAAAKKVRRWSWARLLPLLSRNRLSLVCFSLGPDTVEEIYRCAATLSWIRV
jgi:hypothetical protein